MGVKLETASFCCECSGPLGILPSTE